MFIQSMSKDVTEMEMERRSITLLDFLTDFGKIVMVGLF